MLTEMTRAEFPIDKRKRYTRKQKIGLWLLVITVIVFLVWLWCSMAEKSAHVMPAYPRIDIEAYLQKERLSTEEHEILFQQTGLAEVAVEELLQSGRTQEILLAQENLFREVEIECTANTIISREERCVGGHIPYVEEGDILISFNSHVFGWRNGHAAIVVDAEKRLTLEARVLGTDSVIMSMEHWEKYPSFVVLRLKGATKEERKEIADYAKENLAGVPYRLTAGMKSAMTRAENIYNRSVFGGNGDIWKDGFGVMLTRVNESELGRNEAVMINTAEESITGTHCAHLVWCAYEHYGYNLDSDGGLIVTPCDIYGSSLLEPVQVYGMDILELQ